MVGLAFQPFIGFQPQSEVRTLDTQNGAIGSRKKGNGAVFLRRLGWGPLGVCQRRGQLTSHPARSPSSLPQIDLVNTSELCALHIQGVCVCLSTPAQHPPTEHTHQQGYWWGYTQGYEQGVHGGWLQQSLCREGERVRWHIAYLHRPAPNVCSRSPTPCVVGVQAPGTRGWTPTYRACHPTPGGVGTLRGDPPTRCLRRGRISPKRPYSIQSSRGLPRATPGCVPLVPCLLSPLLRGRGQIVNSRSTENDPSQKGV